MKLLLAAAAALSFATAAQAAPQVTAAWSRPAGKGSTGAGFMTLTNPGGPADTLVEVESPFASSVQIHESSMQGGVASMRAVKAVPAPAGGRVTFGPGGYHLMFLDLKRPLKMGDVVPATLTFASGARVKAGFVVGLAPPAAAQAHR